VLKGLEGRNISLPEDVLLPAGVVKSVKLPGKYPSWLPGKISEKEVRVTVAVDKASEIYSGSYLGWMKAKIKGAGALVVNDSWPIVFYENPDDVFNEDLAELAFVNFVYCEDHDTYDTQFEDFMRCAEGDHMKLTGKYDLSKLLFGLWLSGISPFDVHSLKVEKKAGKMVVMTDKGEKTLRI